MNKKIKKKIKLTDQLKNKVFYTSINLSHQNKSASFRQT